MRRWWIVLLLALTGCSAPSSHTAAAASSPPSATASASPSAFATSSPSPSSPASPSPTSSPAVVPSPTLLFAALEAKGTANPLGWNTVAIAGLDGYARAKATFTPMPLPWVGCAGPVLPQPAQVAAGRVYFADGTGVIRSLAPGGLPTEVTRLPMTSSQQMLSFAVSLDGTRLLATIFTIPPKPTGSDPCVNGGPMFGPGAFTLDVYAAQSGGAAGLLYHQDLPATSTQPIPNVMAFIGWDRFGPEGTYPTAWATQGGGPHHYNGLPVRIDASTGKVTGPVSDPNVCSTEDIAWTGDYLCAVDGTTELSVRKPDGGELWHYTLPADAPYFLEFVSPDENYLLAVGSTNSVIGRDGSITNLAANFPATGWLDSQTVIGGGYGTRFAYIFLGAPTTAVDIGFTGMFLAIVRD